MNRKTIFATISLITLFSPVVFRADGPSFTFKLVSSSYDTVTLEPVLPTQFHATKLEGDNPATTFVQCTVITRKDGEGSHNFLKCGTAVYRVDGVLFSH